MTKDGITEGVAFTFVTPEEGGELTRIEMRINRQLIRDEIKDFQSVAPPRSETPPGETGSTDTDAAGEPAPRKEAPPQLSGGRRPRRIRRAL